jgi:hypothetical protein
VVEDLHHVTIAARARSGTPGKQAYVADPHANVVEVNADRID